VFGVNQARTARWRLSDVGDSETLRRISKSAIFRPQGLAGCDCGSEQVNVDPPEAFPHQAMAIDEADDVLGCEGGQSWEVDQQ
jgi:hypothetical protein